MPRTKYSKSMKLGLRKKYDTDAGILKKSIVLLEQLPNIAQVTLSSLSLFGSKIRIRINDKVRCCDIDISRETFDFLLGRSSENFNFAKMSNRFENDGTKYDSEESLQDKTITMNEVSSESVTSIAESFVSCASGNVNGNHEEQEESKGKNETYELIEPEIKLHEKENDLDKNFNHSMVERIKPSFADRSHTYTSSPHFDYLANRIPILETNSFTPNLYRSRKSNTPVEKNATSMSPFIFNANTTGPKYGTPKKMPNFAKIHANMFEKSESIVDVKNRLKDRHVLLTALRKKNLPKKAEINLPPTSKLKKVLKNSQFELKSRKQEALGSVLRSKNDRHLKSKQERRDILNGVRSNRRFDLLMKARDCKKSI